MHHLKGNYRVAHVVKIEPYAMPALARPALPGDCLKACPTCKAPVFLRLNNSIVAHYSSAGGDGNRRCSASETIYRDSYPLWIFIRAWERHDCASVALRDYLRGVWQAAGNATAVEV